MRRLVVQFRPRVTVVVVLGPASPMSLCCRFVSGAARHPAWYFNLVAHPEVRVEVGHDAYSAIVRVATGEERARLWDYVMETAPPYRRYQRTAREIPLVVLQRTP